MNSGFGRRSTDRRDEFDFMDEPATARPASTGGMDKATIFTVLSAIALFGIGYVVAEKITSRALSGSSTMAASSEDDELRMTTAEKGTAAGYRKLSAIQAKVVEEMRPQLPMRVDGMMTLFDVRSSGVMFEYLFRIKANKSRINMAKFIDVGRKGLRRKVCGTSSMRQTLKFGGVYQYSYYDKDNQFIQSFTMGEEACS